MSSKSIYSYFKPTYLYIKQHTVTGKLYFGKTIKNPEKYLGSGIHWKSHINKHGKEHVVNLWYCLFYDKDECVKTALMLSEMYNIVESKEWLNQIPENGLSNTFEGSTHTEETRIKISKATKGRKPWNKGVKGIKITISDNEHNRRIEFGKKYGGSNKGIPHTEKAREKQSKAQTGKKRGKYKPETKPRNISASGLESWRRNALRLAESRKGKKRKPYRKTGGHKKIRCSCIICQKEVTTNTLSNHIKRSH